MAHKYCLILRIVTRFSNIQSNTKLIYFIRQIINTFCIFYLSILVALLFLSQRDGEKDRKGRERNRYFVNQYLVYLYLIALDFPSSVYPVSDFPISGCPVLDFPMSGYPIPAGCRPAAGAARKWCIQWRSFCPLRRAPAAA